MSLLELNDITACTAICSIMHLRSHHVGTCDVCWMSSSSAIRGTINSSHLSSPPLREVDDAANNSFWAQYFTTKNVQTTNNVRERLS